ncbi:lysophospholipase II [Xylaria bambusicola]|uniref:lysophospholipase II n=1 Tax=Xylaria bambusicola TaxID=326684 RepID=UPI002007D695|nr:lysophospholipase II [Xylaria bambusicola]KAI0506438.1 lysophospholipase II [Xylaria bambusicola]
MASDTTHVVAPKAAHTYTVILLHGRDSTSREFADEFFESEASGPLDQPRTLLDLFPNIRWVFPSASITKSKRFDVFMSQWFDIWSVENPAEQPELQQPGLHQSTQRILDIIKNEETLVPRENIFLGGISQGCATAITAYFADTTRLAGFIGLCGWMPVTSHTQTHQEVTESNHTTPIFLGHSADDDVVPIDNGRELRDILQSRQLEVEWKEYVDGGHWINEPQGVDDIAGFLYRYATCNNSEL